MFCKYCGANCPDEAEFCATCGKKLNETPAQETPVAETYQQPAYEAPVYQAPEEPKQEGKGFGIASLVLSIVSIVCCGGGGICAILGLIFGIISNKKGKNGVATAGLVISIISLVIGLLAIIASIVIYAIYGVSLLAMLGMSEVAADPYYYY